MEDHFENVNNGGSMGERHPVRDVNLPAFSSLGGGVQSGGQRELV